MVAYIIKPHVLFSDDGRIIWGNKDRLHKARRSQCRNWWNPDWRDRILAVMTWLADEEGQITIKLGNNVDNQVSSCPLTFNSPVFYADPEKGLPSISGEEEYYNDDLDEMEDGGEE